ncbi:Uncharacterized conserved protein, DUF2252 family [Lentzea xinjiangensis]|uniref:Uncharacterized conserved protein, DUF2252 family n=1 Tax=Lentzea xinjiangensis TaxID=402600 RepID=A0A1H9MI45_9PSEU|nr:DUF2252 domain-containing protein [Lentzea xinjiangensis]SER23362.1 Uncharacterized conserved protein, DUF2252 family [Lentzea xinjiangensis]
MADRSDRIVGVLEDAFSGLMSADPAAFRHKFRKMAAEPFAFYRGSACLFYADMAELPDEWVDERTSRIWIQGDLHAQNFGTYMDSEGTLVFDVNDFDEAYLGAYTWDVRRLAASMALLGWRKALPDSVITDLIRAYASAYVHQVRRFAEHPEDELFSLRLDNTEGALHRVLQRARLATRIGLLEERSVVVDYDRRFRRDRDGIHELRPEVRARVEEAFESYLDTIPTGKRANSRTYTVKDVVGRSGFGIGSAGLHAYNILVEGRTQALENDVVLSMKQANVAAPSRIVHDEGIREYFTDHGHRTAVSQRALQAHADPWLGHTRIDGVGYVVSELSPYEADLDWSDLTEPADMLPVLGQLGRATAKMHCVADEDSAQTLVDFQCEEAIAAVIGDREEAFADSVVAFALDYARQTREDHRLFVDAFREGRMRGVGATAS